MACQPMLAVQMSGWLDRLFPAQCLLCGAPGGRGLDLCAGCLGDLPHNPHPCPRCAQPLVAEAPPGSLCGPCQRRPPPFDRCLAPFQYRDGMAHLIRGLKFQAHLSHARLLATLLREALEAAGGPYPQRIVPVPLHGARLRERGFNQALEIARPVARGLGLPLDLGTCERHRATAPQTGLDALARRRNLRGAFRLVRSPGVQHLALVDDVVTTGSTARELARLFKRAGVERVEVWAVAKRV